MCLWPVLRGEPDCTQQTSFRKERDEKNNNICLSLMSYSESSWEIVENKQNDSCGVTQKGISTADAGFTQHICRWRKCKNLTLNNA